MRSFALLGVVVGLLAVTAIITPWVAWVVPVVAGRAYPLSRVYNRVLEVLLVIALPLAWRRLDLGNAAAIGFRRAGWARELARGLGAGLAGVAVGLVLCGLLGGLDLGLRFGPLKTARKALAGAVAAIVVGVGEEALFRGVVLRRASRDFGRIAGVALTTAIYAAVHTIRNVDVRGPVTAWSGVARTAALFAPLTSGAVLPELVGLTLFGLVLAAARLRTGSLWTSIGVHAAWVAGYRVGRLFFAIRAEPGWLVGAGWPPLVGGAAGWVAVAVTALVLVARSRAALGGTGPRSPGGCP